MSSLRSDLQSDDPLRQAAALLQVLNTMAGGRDVGTAVTITCQTVIKGPSSPAVKRLGYDVVKAAALTDADWDNVLTGFLTDFSPTYPSVEVQVAAAGMLPLIPVHKLRLVVGPDGKLPSLVTRQISTVVKEVRAAAIDAAGAWLSSIPSTEVLATSPNAAANASKWAEILAEGLLDPSSAVASAAFEAARRIMSSTEDSKLEPGGYFRGSLAAGIAGSMLKALPAVLQRSRSLQQHEQVSAAAALSTLLEYCSRQPQLPGGGHPNGSGTWHIAEQLGGYLEGLLASAYPPLTLEAAQGLLRLCSVGRQQWWAAAQGVAVPASWAPAAIDALLGLWDSQSAAGAALHTPLLEAIAGGIGSLQPLKQLELAKRLFPMVALLPAAAARTAALGHIWGALVAQDIAAHKARRLGKETPAVSDLRASLTDPYLVDVISAPDSEEDDPTLAAFREEVVCTLVETLMSHPQAVTEDLSPKEQDGSASLMATVKAAARAQRAAALVDWLGAAKTTLQGTKTCLGWDRDPIGPTYACTVVTDSWLMLLQRALQAAKALQAAPPPQGDAATVMEAAHIAAASVGAFQELLDQLLNHWQALSSAVQPRALWVVAHHFELAPSMDASWAHLLQALATSFGVQDDDASTRRKSALKAAAAAGQMRPPKDSGFATVDESEIRAEAMAVGLVAADRLASLLLHNAEVGLRPGLKEISAALVAILQPLAAPGSVAGSQPREHAARVVAYLTPLAIAPTPSQEAGEAIAVQTEFGAKLFPAPDWPRNEGFPMAGPAGATLQTTRRGGRYWSLKSHVQAAVAAAASKPHPPLQDPQELPEAVGILEVMSILAEEGDMGPGTVLTAPDDPLRLTAWHAVDREAATAALQFEAYNQLGVTLEGATIKLGLGGPVVPQAKQPPAYKLAVLPPQEWVRWRFNLRITGAGRISVLPLVVLPVTAMLEPGDSVALRCEQYTIPLSALLAPPSPVPTPDVFFPAWPSMAAGAELTGVCRNRGAVGGLHALTALEGGPLARVYLQPMPALGGFHAAYAGEMLGGARVGMVLTAQLLPIGHTPPASQRSGPVPQGHVVCRISLRSTDASLTAAVAAYPARWIAELFGRTMVEGVDADGLAGPGVPFRLHPSLIPIERVYAASAETGAPAAEDDAAEGDEQPAAKRDVAETVESAVSAEWLRLRQLRLGAAA